MKKEWFLVKIPTSWRSVYQITTFAKEVLAITVDRHGKYNLVWELSDECSMQAMPKREDV